MNVSIPQAVSTVATNLWKLILLQEIIQVSIPQAVSTVATDLDKDAFGLCLYVSIPQAVSTVATT